jgi:hypothetical protein
MLIKNDNFLEQSNILQNKIIEKSHNNLVLICIIVNDTNKHKIYGIFIFGQISINISFIIYPKNIIFNQYYEDIFMII